MVHFLKRIASIVLVAAVWIAAMVNPASAAPEKALPISISKDVTLALPWGDLKLTNVALQVAMGADGSVERLRGTADMPFPTFGVLDDTRIVTPARADVGLELGKNLNGLNLALEPDRQYLFLNVDTAFGMAARTPGKASELSFSLEPGQHLALVFDTVEPVAYLDGQITLSLDDQIALLGGVLEDTAIGPYVPDSLPLRERTQFAVAGKFSKDLAESYIKLTGAYVMDGGLLPARLGIEATAGAGEGLAHDQSRRCPCRRRPSSPVSSRSVCSTAGRISRRSSRSARGPARHSPASRAKWLCRWRSCRPTPGRRSARRAMSCAAGWPRRSRLVN